MLHTIKLRYKNSTHFKRTKQNQNETKPIKKNTPNQIEFKKKTRKNQPTKAQFQQNA